MRVQYVLALCHGARAGKAGNLLRQLRFMLASALGGGKAGVLNHIFPPKGAAQAVESRISGTGDDNLAIQGWEGAEGHAGGMAVAHPLGIFSKDAGIDHRVFQTGEGGIQHGNVHKLAFPRLFPVIQSRRRRPKRIQSGEHIAGRSSASHGGPVRFAG